MIVVFVSFPLNLTLRIRSFTVSYPMIARALLLSYTIATPFLLPSHATYSIHNSENFPIEPYQSIPHYIVTTLTTFTLTNSAIVVFLPGNHRLWSASSSYICHPSSFQLKTKVSPI